MKVAIAKMKCGRKGGAGAASFQIVLEKKKTNQRKEDLRSVS